MGDESAGSELDAGTVYPTIMEDTNGNQIAITYAAGVGAGYVNSSARITLIQDTRGGYGFTYNADPIPHLATIVNSVGTSENYTFTYAENQPLTSPFSPAQQFGTTTCLMSVGTTGLGVSTDLQYGSGTGEMTGVVTPLGGTLQWDYHTYTYSGGRSYREVLNRYMTPSPGGTQYSWTFTMDGTNPNLHDWTIVGDTGAASAKVWWFNTTAGPLMGLVTAYEERNSASFPLRHKDYAWTTDAGGRPYISYAYTTLSPSTPDAIQSQTGQILDAYGNITEQNIWDYGSTGTPLRTYDFQYLTDPNYTSRYIRNRVTLSTVTANGTPQTLALNYYDNGAIWSGCDPALQDQPFSRLHDSAYNAQFRYRGNLTQTTGFDGEKCVGYQTSGVANYYYDGSGRTYTTAPSISTDYSLPGTISPNGDSSMATSVSYAASFAITSVTGVDGANSTTTYDSYGRPASTKSPDGATTTYTYTYNPNVQTATLGTRWKKTTLDGFGRVVRVETGHDQTTVSTVDTVYGPCGCSPLGKLKQVSQPYAPGGQVYWTVYSYDGSGRTVSVTAPDGASATTYTYQGNRTTVTDPAGKWKTFTTDAAGNLTAVTEPNPNGGADLTTTYTYNGANQLVGVSMLRDGYMQTRSFVWSGKDLMSATNPENGTVNYTYDGAHHVTSRTDAKLQQTQWDYDVYGRLMEVRHYIPQGTPPVLQEQTAERVDYHYDTNQVDSTFAAQNVWGRLAAVTFQSHSGEVLGSAPMAYMYSYNQAGRVTNQRMQLLPPTQVQPPQAAMNFDAAYAWDNEGRMTSETYPTCFGTCGAAPTYAFQFDSMGRPNGMTEDIGSGPSTVGTASFGPAGELTNLYYYGYSETRTYNNLLQLTRMTVPGTMDMEYRYSPTQNNGRITQSKDWITGEEVTYTYDSLQRLVRAETTDASWGDAYSYDGFGNLTQKTVTKGQAPPFSAYYDPAHPGGGDPNGLAAMSIPGASAYPYDVENHLLRVPDGAYGAWAGYGPWGKRVTKRTVATSQPQYDGTWEIYFYGITGQRLATFGCEYQFDGNGDATQFTCDSEKTNIYFGGKLVKSDGVTVVTDRLGSVRANSNGERFSYFPWGEERTTTADGRQKFGTYVRDSGGLDYADQRYYSNIPGRFLTPDPAGFTVAKSKDPTSWNMFAYVTDDPINNTDPTGKLSEWDDPNIMFFPTDGESGGIDVCSIFDFDPSAELSCWTPGPVLPPLPVPVAPEESCTLNFEYRGLDVPVVGLVAGHGYLDFVSSSGTTTIFEGYHDGYSDKLKASDGPTGLPADDPSKDNSAGSITGSFVCDWDSLLIPKVSEINRADIDYNASGPNSNSVLRYFLSQLPATFTPWFSVPSGLIGFYTKLPGLEP